MTEPVLEARHLTVEIRARHGVVRPLDDVSLTVDRGEALGLVGESGSGKSMTLRTILGILPRQARILEGEVLFHGQDLIKLDRKSLRRIQGRSISMVFQEPMTALNPLMRVGEQIGEAPLVHFGYTKKQALARALELMRLVGIPDPERRLRAFPHELSGGMRQRVVIALALACQPEVVLCDEPTTALDVTIQDQILKLLVNLCREMDVSLVFVTHDFPVVSHVCQRLAVMYAGRIMETALVKDVLREPRHPYTYSLLRSVPDFDKVRDTLRPIQGAPPDLAFPPSGCRFHPRCPIAHEDCAEGQFPLLTLGGSRASACRYHEHCAELVRAEPVLLDEGR